MSIYHSDTLCLCNELNSPIPMAKTNPHQMSKIAIAIYFMNFIFPKWQHGDPLGEPFLRWRRPQSCCWNPLSAVLGLLHFCSLLAVGWPLPVCKLLLVGNIFCIHSHDGGLTHVLTLSSAVSLLKSSQPTVSFWYFVAFHGKERVDWNINYFLH